jgi:hypothetical protein
MATTLAPHSTPIVLATLAAALARLLREFWKLRNSVPLPRKSRAPAILGKRAGIKVLNPHG